MLKLLDIVDLKADGSDIGIKAGTEGTIIDAFLLLYAYTRLRFTLTFCQGIAHDLNFSHKA